MSNSVRGANTLSLRNTASGQRRQQLAYPELEVQLALARTETERVRAEAADARATAEKAKAKMLKDNRDAKVRMRVTAVIMMTAALLKVAWEAAHDKAPVPTASVVQPLSTSSNPSRALTQHGGREGNAAVDDSPGARALERLRDAFHSFPELDQPSLVDEVNRRHIGPGTACPIAWKQGFPSLSIGNRNGIPPSMVQALNNCADAIEQLRAEKDAATQ